MDKQTETALEKVHRGKGILYWEIMAQFLLLVIPKVQGREFFDQLSYMYIERYWNDACFWNKTKDLSFNKCSF